VRDRPGCGGSDGFGRLFIAKPDPPEHYPRGVALNRKGRSTF
jgi:hypothetical protein